MRYLRFSFLNEDINIDFSEFIDIVIENKSMKYEFLKYCFLLFNGKTNFITLQCDGDFQNNEKSICFVNNLFDLNLNTKKNLAALYKILKLKYYDELKNEISALKDKATQLVEMISLDFDMQLYFNSEIKEDDIFKAFDLKFLEDDNLTLKEQIIKFCTMIYELQKIDIFIFRDLHQFLDEADIESLFYELKYLKIKIINVESFDNFTTNHYSKKIIIDETLCLIK